MADLFSLKITSIFFCCSFRRPIVCATDLSSHQRPTGPNCELERVPLLSTRAFEAELCGPADGPPGPIPPAPPPGPIPGGGGVLCGGPCAEAINAVVATKQVLTNRIRRSRSFMDSSILTGSSCEKKSQLRGGIR